MSAFRTCQQRQTEERQRQKQAYDRLYMTTVWVPGTDGGMVPHHDATILHQGATSIRFQTRYGHVLEQHGIFKVETRRR